tara:strand:+ start:4781 stop:5884 length:1104 start_codon:yes stop_codon:yes gene_type:complete
VKINAVTLDVVGGPVQVEEVDLEQPHEGEVLVKMGASGVCHSDQHSITGQHPADLPCVVGHEGAGEVVAVGSGVSSVKVGDHVALNWQPNCGNCFYCDRSEHALCREVTNRVWSGYMADGTSRISRDGKPLLHYSGVSTWADHMVVDQACCEVIPDEVPYEVAAIIGCAVATGVGAAIYRGQVSPDHRVVVVGAGGVGLSAIMGASMAGAKQIIAVDQALEKELMARELGATDFILSSDRDVEKVLEMTEGRGADVVIEAIGVPRIQQIWLDGVRPGGNLVLVGVPSVEDDSTFGSANLIRMQKTITGSYFSATDTGKAIRDLCEVYLEGLLPIDRLISRRVRINEIQEALNWMLTGKEGRIVITFD